MVLYFILLISMEDQGWDAAASCLACQANAASDYEV